MSRPAIVASLRGENDRLRARRADLAKQLAKLDQRIAAIDVEIATFSGIYSLPDDITPEIPESPHAHHLIACHVRTNTLPETPLTFSHVSRKF